MKIWYTENSINNCNYFISSKGIDEEHAIHLKSGNIEIMNHDKVDEVTEESFRSFLFKYQIELDRNIDKR